MPHPQEQVHSTDNENNNNNNNNNTDTIANNNYNTILKKQITSLKDIDNFQKSNTYQELLSFILSLNQSVIGKPLSSQCFVSPVLLSLSLCFLFFLLLILSSQ